MTLSILYFLIVITDTLSQLLYQANRPTVNIYTFNKNYLKMATDVPRSVVIFVLMESFRQEKSTGKRGFFSFPEITV